VDATGGETLPRRGPMGDGDGATGVKFWASQSELGALETAASTAFLFFFLIKKRRTQDAGNQDRFSQNRTEI